MQFELSPFNSESGRAGACGRVRRRCASARRWDVAHQRRGSSTPMTGRGSERAEIRSRRELLMHPACRAGRRACGSRVARFCLRFPVDSVSSPILRCRLRLLSARSAPERERGMRGDSARPLAPTRSSQTRSRPAAAFVWAKSRGQNKLARILKPPEARQASRPREAPGGLSPRRRRERQPKAARSPLRKRVSCRAGRVARRQA